jgi:hypothetical protein
VRLFDWSRMGRSRLHVHEDAQSRNRAGDGIGTESPPGLDGRPLRLWC